VNCLFRWPLILSCPLHSCGFLSSLAFSQESSSYCSLQLWVFCLLSYLFLSLKFCLCMFCLVSLRLHTFCLPFCLLHHLAPSLLQSLVYCLNYFIGTWRLCPSPPPPSICVWIL
jgi:hypothetical protein